METHSLRPAGRSATASIFFFLLLSGSVAGTPAQADEEEESCEIELNDVRVVRGKRAFLRPKLTTHGGFELEEFEWTFTGGIGGTRRTRKPHTDIKLVDATQQYTATAKAISETGANCQTTVNVTVTPRLWQIDPTVKQDNEQGWGKLPLAVVGTVNALGRTRDRSSDADTAVVPSPFVPNKQWENGYRVEQVDDPNGPNDGYHYIKNTNFKIDMETVINRWIKPSARKPSGAPSNWFDFNHTCVGDSAVFLQAVKNHESGLGGGESTGHFGLIKQEEAKNGMDPQTEIEDNVGRSRDEVIRATNRELRIINEMLWDAGDPDHRIIEGNWDGKLGVSFWDPNARLYSPCNRFKRVF